MRTKKFNVSIAPYNTVKVFDSEFGTLIRSIKVEGTVLNHPTVVENTMMVKVRKNDEIFDVSYALPHGIVKESVKVEK